jgi:hypothetical protein
MKHTKRHFILLFALFLGFSVAFSSCSVLLAPTNNTDNNQQNNTNGGKTNGGKTNGGSGTTTNTGGKTKG